MQKHKIIQIEPRHPQERLQHRTSMITFLTLLLLSLIVTMRMALPYLLSVFMGGILALLSHPLYQRLNRKKLRPKLSSAIVTLGVTLLVIAPIFTILSLAINQGIALGHVLTSNENFNLKAILNNFSNMYFIKLVIGNPAAFENQVKTWIQAAGQQGTALILSMAADIPAFIIQILLAIISCFFLLIDGETLLHWTSDRIPLDRDVRYKVLNSFKNTAVSVIWASLAAALAQSTIILFSFLILKIPASFLAAGATFIFAWIPILGSAPIWISAVIYLYTQSTLTQAGIMLIFGFFTGAIDNFVRPLVLKGRGSMHPLISLIAIFGGVKMFGITGIFIGPILTAILISLLQIWPSVGYRFGLMAKLKTIT